MNSPKKNTPQSPSIQLGSTTGTETGQSLAPNWPDELEELIEPDWVADIRYMMDCYEQDTPVSPAWPDKKTALLRMALIEEEWDETRQAFQAQDLTKFADGIIDMLVVTIGTG
ncbi:MAG: hypothetical protein DRI46_10110 [Chloroflexi bacterium]|nr:MAG: hypothetical protein DRI46_10110 [Chloroflexota bacterium]